MRNIPFHYAWWDTGQTGVGALQSTCAHLALLQVPVKKIHLTFLYTTVGKTYILVEEV